MLRDWTSNYANLKPMKGDRGNDAPRKSKGQSKDEGSWRRREDSHNRIGVRMKIWGFQVGRTRPMVNGGAKRGIKKSE